MSFDIIQSEWKSRAPELADWAMERLVNRRDVWGQYAPLSAKEKLGSKRTYKALTLPQVAKRGSDMVTLEKLQRHFGGTRVNHLIGLHARSREHLSKWMAIDIDLHDTGAPDAEEAARRNESAAVAWWEALQARGYDPLLVESNGRGGFHLWVLFAEPAPTADVYAFGQDTIRDWEKRNLDATPETYPRSASDTRVDPRTGKEKLGSWLRLPGRHHTFEFFTRVWSGEPWLDEPWLAGNTAIDLLLSNQPGPPPPPADGAAPAKKVRKGGTGFRAERLTVCVDLDGVLARYDGFRGAGNIGGPIDGATEFCRRLSAYADIVIHSARVRDEDTQAQVRAWLEVHRIPHHEVHLGPGKPIAHAYIDDRAVPCRPQQEGTNAFEQAEDRIRELHS